MSIPSLMDKGVLLAEVEVVARLVEEVIVDGPDRSLRLVYRTGART